MTTLTPVYGSVATLTFGLASLANDSTNYLAGRESAAADNTSDLADDCMVGGKITTGTSPTAGRQIEVWAIGSYDGTSFSGNATGADANLTLTAPTKALLKLLQIIPTDATSNHLYTWGPFSVAQAFGGTMPRKWSIFVVQGTGVALNATAGNHELKYTPIKYQST
jgi:hypothetical protein